MLIKVQIWLVQSLGFIVQNLRLSTINSNPRVAYVISSISYSPLPFWLCLFVNSLLTLFHLRNSRIDVFVWGTHCFLASHSVSSSLHRKAFSLIVVSNCQLFYLSWSLTKLAILKESYSRRTTTVIVNSMALTKVLSFS